MLKLLVLPGDGIGPEVMAAALSVAEVAAKAAGITLDVTEGVLGGAAYDTHGSFCTDATLAGARGADAVMVGAVGGPKWDGIRLPGGPEMQDGLMRLRLELDVYAGLRPAWATRGLEAHSPLRAEIVAGADVMVLREMCGGPFFGGPRGIDRPKGGARVGYDNYRYDEVQIARFARAGFQLARRRKGRIASADKSNVMENCVLWREVVTEVAGEYPDVELAHYYADNLVFQLSRRPRDFDLILSDNLFGDIISDHAANLAGSLGLLPSACLPGIPAPGAPQPGGIYEPVHGSAPDIAGRGIANPAAMILSFAMMFDFAAARPQIGASLKAAVAAALQGGARTPDLGGTSTSAAMRDAVIAALKAQ